MKKMENPLENMFLSQLESIIIIKNSGEKVVVRNMGDAHEFRNSALMKINELSGQIKRFEKVKRGSAGGAH